jgi:hypothetical protein
MILQTPFKRPSNAMHTQRPLECRRPSNAQFHTLAFKRPTYAKPFRVQTPFKRLSTHPPITPWRVNAPLGRSRLPAELRFQDEERGLSVRANVRNVPPLFPLARVILEPARRRPVRQVVVFRHPPAHRARLVVLIPWEAVGS